jgi:hypothetical protein
MNVKAGANLADVVKALNALGAKSRWICWPSSGDEGRWRSCAPILKLSDAPR